jgi:hypothetical protein
MICRLNEMYLSSQLESSKSTQMCNNRILEGIEVENEGDEQNKIYFGLSFIYFHITIQFEAWMNS